jgi:hypothetical protein
MSMPITKQSYEELKEYWDYQRKVEYNKEMVYRMAEQFENRLHTEYGVMSLKDIKDLLWSRIKSEEYEEPHKGWIPEDKQLRFEWEGEPTFIKTSEIKSKWKEAFDEE